MDEMRVRVWSHAHNRISTTEDLCKSLYRDFEPMMSTGLKDRGGTEIFEGDILTEEFNEDYPYTVVWDKDRARFIAWSEKLHREADVATWMVLKVAGNIHEKSSLASNEKRSSQCVY